MIPQPRDLTGRFFRVLVVEDNRVLRRALVRTVSRWAPEVVATASISEATSALATAVDLVISDVRLPDGKGHMVFEQALRLEPRPLLIAISGKATAVEAFELARLEVRAFVPKPFSELELERCVLRALEQREHRDRMAMPSASAPVLIETELGKFADEHCLTERQTQMVRMLLSGVSREQLPTALGVSENTCKTAVRRLLARCDVERLADVIQLVLVRLGPNSL
jgi:DNA-binding NarL/FixJ family response regulator